MHRWRKRYHGSDAPMVAQRALDNADSLRRDHGRAKALDIARERLQRAEAGSDPIAASVWVFVVATLEGGR